MTKEGSKCFLQFLEAKISPILVIAPWPLHPILHLLSEEGRSPHYPQAAAGWGNLKSLNMGQFREAASAWVLQWDAVLWGWAAGAVNLFTFPGLPVKARWTFWWLSPKPLLSPSNTPLPVGERKTKSPEGFFAQVWSVNSVLAVNASCKLFHLLKVPQLYWTWINRVSKSIGFLK